jgi:hypothetical protein
VSREPRDRSLAVGFADAVYVPDFGLGSDEVVIERYRVTRKGDRAPP